MSDARQAISAAQEARAEKLAPAQFANAKRHLDFAAEQLEYGLYLEARQAAIAAKQEAVRARDLAISTEGKM